MATISLCMIVRNEEQVLARCLDSICGIVDEIILVDTGSVDQTIRIAGRYTEKIFRFPWIDDFSAARNFSLEQATMDFCMWMDADDVLPPECAEKFRRKKEELDHTTDMVMMPYETAFDSQGRPLFVYERERILRRGAGFRFLGRVHEAIPPAGKVVHWKVPIRHKKEKTGNNCRNLRIYQKMETDGETFDGRSLYYYARELQGQGHYEKAEVKFREFLKRTDGWKENKIDAARQLAFCCYQMKKEEEALEALLKTFVYDVPRGEVCCDIGRHFLDRENYRQAVYWYEQALKAEKKMETGAFVQEECYGFLPAISLCICFDRLGDTERAEKYNELAGKFCPDSKYYKANQEYFQRKRLKQHRTKEAL